MAAASFPPNFSNVGILENCAGMEAANGAIEHDFHNALVPINGSHSGSSGRSTPNGGDPAPGKLFVGGLSWQTSSEKLREYFGMFGTVTDVLIMKDPVTQISTIPKGSRHGTIQQEYAGRRTRRTPRTTD
ncbi:heterogeneous nuclear ribonucleoprotein A1-like 2 isoform X1 [Apis dorsata]|uniref:heterogeneous nuclear ribonucleoprotein A1-like 2 isoform X1 n=2 Tax=Apis dorsata TaxID=7462 RepID=UPI0003DF7ABF|nr:heterogeneous nuclear ribonucleoprotein A1-like 2 isoform X1 [Apis dorsata]